MPTPDKKRYSKPKPKKQPIDLIWGIHPVSELITHNPANILKLRFLKQKTGKIQDIIDLAEGCGLTYHFADKPYPDTPEHAAHQGVQARIKPIQTVSLSDLLVKAEMSPTPPLILALDNIQDPHNFGAMIRSAAAAGATGILFTKDRSAPLSGTVAKVSTGAISHLPLCPVTNLANTLQRLKKKGFWVYGAEGTAPQSIYQTDFHGPVCLVIGGEAKGIRPLVKKQCDALVSIPMHSSLDSLNASVAAAIIMFEVVRQQK